MSIYPMYQGAHTCERCHKKVDPDKAVWLELNSHTGTFEEVGTVPENESQGCFAFGPDCIKAVRKDREGWKYIGLAVRNGESND